MSAGVAKSSAGVAKSSAGVLSKSSTGVMIKSSSAGVPSKTSSRSGRSKALSRSATVGSALNVPGKASGSSSPNYVGVIDTEQLGDNNQLPLSAAEHRRQKNIEKHRRYYIVVNIF